MSIGDSLRSTHARLSNTGCSGFVARVVASHRRTFRRKLSKTVPYALDPDGAEATPSMDPAPSTEVEQREALRLVVRLLDSSTRTSGKVLALTEFEEISAVEIANCLGLNVNTVYARLRAARQAFDAAHAAIALAPKRGCRERRQLEGTFRAEHGEPTRPPTRTVSECGHARAQARSCRRGCRRNDDKQGRGTRGARPWAGPWGSSASSFP